MKQISIFIENEKGKLALVTDLLSKNGINLRALSIADTTDYGILRIITDNVDKAMSILSENGYLTKINEVVCIKIADEVGSLNKIITALSSADIAVEYTYAFASSEPGVALMVFRVDDNEKAISALGDAHIAVVK